MYDVPLLASISFFLGFACVFFVNASRILCVFAAKSTIPDDADTGNGGGPGMVTICPLLLDDVTFDIGIWGGGRGGNEGDVFGSCAMPV